MIGFCDNWLAASAEWAVRWMRWTRLYQRKLKIFHWKREIEVLLDILSTVGDADKIYSNLIISPQNRDLPYASIEAPIQSHLCV